MARPAHAPGPARRPWRRGSGGEEGAGGSGGQRGGGASRPAPGTYTLKLTLGDSTATGTLVLRPDPLLKQ